MMSDDHHELIATVFLGIFLAATSILGDGFVGAKFRAGMLICGCCFIIIGLFVL
ncbi:hypothetical protein [Novosphingobium sp. YAF33]|uniref:hypothetical protein n=1 Tax=Novosphingobium sp. YAF33 TaxID=3233082 RepID=UPI003F9DD413